MTEELLNEIERLIREITILSDDNGRLADALKTSRELRTLQGASDTAEIERLRSENVVKSVDVQRLSTEIERLRDDRRMLLLCESDRKQMSAEIERLRRELSYHIHTDEDIKVQNAEIERLRAALRYARDVAAGHVNNRCYDCLELMQHIDRELAEGRDWERAQRALEES